MKKKKTPFERLKASCTRACRARQACPKGYAQMLATENVGQMMATWRSNWDDVVNSKYADIICAELPKQYPNLKSEMNQAGIYLNECPTDAPSFVRVLITACSEPIHIHDYARAYILAPSQVVAHDHSQIYSRRAEAEIILKDHAYGHVLAGEAKVFDHATLNTMPY